MRKFLLLAMFALLGLVGCSQAPSTTDAEARKMAEDFLHAIHTGDYNKAFSFCDEEFFSNRKNDEWIEYFTEIKQKLGEINNVKLKRHLIDDRLTGRFFPYSPPAFHYPYLP